MVGGGPVEFFDGADITLGPYPPYSLLFYPCVLCDSVFFPSGFGTHREWDDWDS